MVPRVAVGLPFFNSVDTLAGAIRSVFSQSFSDWELVLVDDGSTDGSLEIARSVKDPRGRVYSDGRNRSLSSRLNEIALLARAPLLARMDADDLMYPRRLERQVQFLDAHPEVDVVGTGICTIDGERRPNGKRGVAPLDLRTFCVAIRGVFIHPTVMGRTVWFLANPYDTRIPRAQDYELWLRTFRRSSFSTLPEMLTFYSEVLDGTLDRIRCSHTSRMDALRRAHNRDFPRWLPPAVMACMSLKMAVYRFLWTMGFRRYLLLRRNAPLSVDEVNEALSTLEFVLSFPVSGLNG